MTDASRGKDPASDRREHRAPLASPEASCSTALRPGFLVLDRRASSEGRRCLHGAARHRRGERALLGHCRR